MPSISQHASRGARGLMTAIQFAFEQFSRAAFMQARVFIGFTERLRVVGFNRALEVLQDLVRRSEGLLADDAEEAFTGVEDELLDEGLSVEGGVHKGDHLEQISYFLLGESGH